jgi:hypothetical protein
MSVAQLKKIIDQTTTEERLFLRTYLSEAFPEDESVDAGRLDQRMKEMDTGRGVAWEEMLKQHGELKAKGL